MLRGVAENVKSRGLDVVLVSVDVAESELTVRDEPVRLLRPASADALISEADFAVDDRLPYWADVWPSSIVLAGHVRGLDGSGRTLLELGCGLGLLGTAAMRT